MTLLIFVFLLVLLAGVPVFIALAGSSLLYTHFLAGIPDFVILHRMAGGEHMSRSVDEERRAALLAADGGRLRRVRQRRRCAHRSRRRLELRQGRQGHGGGESAEQSHAPKYHVVSRLVCSAAQAGLLQPSGAHQLANVLL